MMLSDISTIRLPESLNSIGRSGTYISSSSWQWSIR